MHCCGYSICSHDDGPSTPSSLAACSEKSATAEAVNLLSSYSSLVVKQPAGASSKGPQTSDAAQAAEPAASEGTAAEAAAEGSAAPAAGSSSKPPLGFGTVKLGCQGLALLVMQAGAEQATEGEGAGATGSAGADAVPVPSTGQEAAAGQAGKEQGAGQGEVGKADPAEPQAAADHARLMIAPAAVVSALLSDLEKKAKQPAK